MQNKFNPIFIFVTGASGVGKTSLIKEFEKNINTNEISINYFDTIGVPDFTTMIKDFGSCENWQEYATHLWIKKLKNLNSKKIIILEGQFNPEFAIDACKKFNIKDYKFILIHADRKIREKRLIENRNQPELANEDMNNWAEFLKKKVSEVNGEIIDTSNSNLQENLISFESILEK